MLAIYLDEDVHGGIARGLLSRGIDALTVQADGLSGSADSDILDRATDLGRPVFTNDDDFLAEAHARQLHGIPFAGVFYAHAHTPIGTCIRDLELLALASDPEEYQDRAVFHPLS